MKLNAVTVYLVVLCAAPALSAQQSAAIPVPDVKLAPPTAPLPSFGAPFARSIDDADNGDYAEAIVDASESLRIAEQQLGPDNETVGHILRKLADYRLLNHQPEDARAALVRALHIDGAPNAANDVDLEMAKALIACAQTIEFADTPKPEKATELLQQALTIDERAHGRDSVQTAAVVFELASSLVLQGKFAQAEPLYKRAHGIFEHDSHSTNNALVVTSELASMYVKQKRYADAEPLLKQALAAVKDAPGSSLAAELREHLATVYRNTGRAAEADALAQPTAKRL